jgi:hypothetical protein
MRKLIWTVLSILLLTAAGCSGKNKSKSEDWWTGMTTPGKTMLHTLTLKPHESKRIVMEGKDSRRFGILVRQVWEMKESAGDQGAKVGVFLTQEGTNDFIGTQYSASNVFDLAKGVNFVVENRSSIVADIIVYTAQL